METTQLLTVILTMASFAITIGSPPVQRASDALALDETTALNLLQLPLKCYNQEFPNKDSVVLNSEADLKLPKENHPIFFGCFDWHSAVHGHWLMATLALQFPDSDMIFSKVANVFDSQLTEEKVNMELKFFGQDQHSSFERTYGWAWLLKLQEELTQGAKFHPQGDRFATWARTLRPLSDHLAASLKAFLPKLVYPIREGEHKNSAFALILAHEYAIGLGDSELLEAIESKIADHYAEDVECHLNYEPSGNDFLSPCLTEADIAGRITTHTSNENLSNYKGWLEAFLPELFKPDFDLSPAQVLDEEDGYLVHLHGLNFSRAWNFYRLTSRLASLKSRWTTSSENLGAKLFKIADEHLLASKDSVLAASSYEGSHWLATFMTLALKARQDALNEQ